MNKTKIEWTNYTWNPVTGCKHGCGYCYARSMYRRFGHSFEPAFHPDRLDEIKTLRKPAKVFVCSVADLFGDWVTDDWIAQVLARTEQHPATFQYLTKNPKRYPQVSFPPNSWVGTTATSQSAADQAIEYLNQAKASVKFISFEPLLGPIHLDLAGLNWIIIGALTGPQARQPDKDWVASLLVEADRCKIPVFLKNNLNWPARQEFPNGSGDQLGLNL